MPYKPATVTDAIQQGNPYPGSWYFLLGWCVGGDIIEPLVRWWLGI